MIHLNTKTTILFFQFLLIMLFFIDYVIFIFIDYLFFNFKFFGLLILFPDVFANIHFVFTSLTGLYIKVILLFSFRRHI